MFNEVYMRMGWLRVFPSAAVAILSPLATRGPMTAELLESELRPEMGSERGWASGAWEPLHEWTDGELEELSAQFPDDAETADRQDAQSVMAEEAAARRDRVKELDLYADAVAVSPVRTLGDLLRFMIACGVLVQNDGGVIDLNPDARLPAEVLPLTPRRQADEDELRWRDLHESTSYRIIELFSPQDDRLDSLRVSLQTLAASASVDPESVRAAIGNLLGVGDFSTSVDVDRLEIDETFELSVDWDLFDTKRIGVRISLGGGDDSQTGSEADS